MSKKTIWQKVLISWAIVGAVTFAAGMGAGFLLHNRADAKTEPVTASMFESDVISDSKTAQPVFTAMRTVPMDIKLQKHVYDIAKEYKLDWTLLMAVIEQESEFDPYTVSEGGDYGLMQINSINHPYLSITLGIHDFLDPEENVRAGAFMLSDLFEKYEDPHKVLMAYQMGEAGAAACWERGITESTYSRSVLRVQKELISANERRETA